MKQESSNQIEENGKKNIYLTNKLEEITNDNKDLARKLKAKDKQINKMDDESVEKNNIITKLR